MLHSRHRRRQINDFAANGLDSGLALSSGFGATGSPASVFGLTPDTFAAFGGINPNVGVGEFNFPTGRSVYDGLQSSFKEQIVNPFPGVNGLDLTIAYTLSQFKGTGGSDQNFSPLAFDFRNSTRFYGPTALDRTHQFKFGLTFDIAHHGPRFSVIGNIASPQPSSLLLPTQGGTTGPGEIFRTDLTGDGTVSDLFPANGGEAGQPGQFMRFVSGSNMGAALNNWNAKQANTPTPAGQALVAAGLFRVDQLQTLGGVKETLATAPSNEASNPIYKDISMVLSWPIRLKEGFVLEPSISAFNVFNMANFSRLGGTSGLLSGAPGSANGTANSHTAPGGIGDMNSVRIGTGSGVFAVGAPRQVEFGLRFTF